MPITSDLQKNYLTYALRAIKVIKPESESSRNLVSTVVSHAKKLGLTSLEKMRTHEPFPRKGNEDADFKTRIARHKRVQTALNNAVNPRANKPQLPEDLTVTKAQTNVRQLGSALGFDDTKTQILEFYLAAKWLEPLTLVQAVFEEYHFDNPVEEPLVNALASVLDLPVDKVDDALLGTEGLITTGFLTRNPNSRENSFFGGNMSPRDITLNESLKQRLLTHDDPNTLLSSFFGLRATSDLKPEDYSYIGEDYEHLAQSLAGASKTRLPGRSNFGIYGPAGTGKTSVLGTLSAQLDIPLYIVGASAITERDNGLDMRFREPKRTDMMSDLMVACYIARKTKSPIILAVDECETMLSISTDNVANENNPNKGVYHTFLSNNTVPIVFITNHISKLQRSTLRRVMPWTEFPQPPASFLARQVGVQAERHKIKLGQDFWTGLIRDFSDFTLGETDNILASVGLRQDLSNMGEDKLKKLIVRLFEGQKRAIQGGFSYSDKIIPPTETPHAQLFNSRSNFADVAHELSGIKDQSFVVTVVGPTGAGKRTFAYALAKQLGWEVAEDTNLPYGNPMTIAEFCNAVIDCTRNHKLLLLSDQSGLANPDAAILDYYEKMLRDYKQPMILTVDTENPNGQISRQLRAGSHYVVNLDYLSPTQNMQAYHAFFGRTPPKVIQTFKTLTPGDFVVLTEKYKALGTPPSDERIIADLHDMVGEVEKMGLVDINVLAPTMRVPKVSVDRIVETRDGHKYMAMQSLLLTLEKRYKMEMPLNPKSVDYTPERGSLFRISSGPSAGLH